MTVTATPVFVQNPKFWTASVGNGDASNWKALLSAGVGAGANGSKISGVTAFSTDTTARNTTLALLRTGTVTVTIASPGVLTFNNHNLAAGDQVFLTTTGALPTGLSPNTTYFVISGGLTSSAFELATTQGGAAINTTGTQSGVHTLWIVRQISTFPVAITAGDDGATPSQNLLTPQFCPGLPLDSDGNPYIFLESTDYLAVSTLTTVTSNKIININAWGGNF